MVYADETTHLRAEVQRALHSIPKETIHHLIDSMPRRVAACIAANGDRIHYSRHRAAKCSFPGGRRRGALCVTLAPSHRHRFGLPVMASWWRTALHLSYLCVHWQRCWMLRWRVRPGVINGEFWVVTEDVETAVTLFCVSLARGFRAGPLPWAWLGRACFLFRMRYAATPSAACSKNGMEKGRGNFRRTYV